MNVIHSTNAETELQLRKTYGAFPTGVTVVTTIDERGQQFGLTCSSFNSVSLAPPLISWSIMKTSSRAQVFSSSAHFAISIMASDQEAVARAFAKSATLPFDNVAHYPAQSGCAQIAGAAAVMDCTTYARYELGDHIMFIGAVRSHSNFEKPALTFFRGSFGMLDI